MSLASVLMLFHEAHGLREIAVSAGEWVPGGAQPGPLRSLRILQGKAGVPSLPCSCLATRLGGTCKVAKCRSQVREAP